MTLTSPATPRAVLRVEPWPDPVIDRLGHDPRSDYVERFWLPVLGPSTTLLLRRLATVLSDQPDGVELDLTSTALSLGLGARNGRHSPFHRALDRCVQFGLAQRSGATFVVRRHLPPLTRGQVRRLPPELQHDHESWERRAAPDTDRALARRARRLALTLLELGESPTDAARQLDLWRFPAAIARDAVDWAAAASTKQTDAGSAPGDPVAGDDGA